MKQDLVVDDHFTVKNLKPHLHFKVKSVSYHSAVFNQHFMAESTKDQDFFQLKRFLVTNSILGDTTAISPPIIQVLLQLAEFHIMTYRFTYLF